MAEKEEADKATAPSETNKPKRPRGRPRKTPVEKAADAPKRPRGRPRKNPEAAPKAEETKAPTKKSAAKKPAAKKPVIKKSLASKTAATDTLASTTADTLEPLDDGTNSAIQVADTDTIASDDTTASKPEDLGGSAAERSDAEDDITVSTEPVMAKNSDTKSQNPSEEQTMNEKEGPSPVGGDSFFEDTNQEKDWGAIALNLVFLFVYGIIAYLMTIGLLALTALRFILTVLNEESAEKVSDFMADVSGAITKVFDYLAGKTDEKPWLD